MLENKVPIRSSNFRNASGAVGDTRNGQSTKLLRVPVVDRGFRAKERFCTPFQRGICISLFIRRPCGRAYRPVEEQHHDNYILRSARNCPINTRHIRDPVLASPEPRGSSADRDWGVACSTRRSPCGLKISRHVRADAENVELPVAGVPEGVTDPEKVRSTCRTLGGVLFWFVVFVGMISGMLSLMLLVAMDCRMSG